MQPVIDAHGHLGDILYADGDALIGRLGVEKARGFDPAALSEARLHADPLRLGRLLYSLLSTSVTRAERARNATATLENLSRSLDETGISHAVCLPIPPHVHFEALAEAARVDTRIVPFTGVDYTAAEPSAKLDDHVRSGARGLKLHPIIQKVPLTSAETRAAVEQFAPHGLPVLVHCGTSSYYLGAEKLREEPRYGAIHFVEELVRDFPSVRFIAGHAGLFEVRQVIAQLSGLSNVCVDTSFQSVARVRELLRAFGPERVLFGSDWPYGARPPALEIVRKACRGDRGLERRTLFENAAELMGLGDAC